MRGQSGPHGRPLGVGLRADQAGEPVDAVAADAADAAGLRGHLAVLVLGEVNPDGQVERVQAEFLQTVG